MFPALFVKVFKISANTVRAASNGLTNTVFWLGLCQTVPTQKRLQSKLAREGEKASREN